MYEIFFFAFSIILISSCNKKTRLYPEIVIDPTEARSFKWEKVVDMDHLISIELKKPNDVRWGNVEQVLYAQGFFFLHDPFQTKTITVFDSVGNYVAQLNKFGGASDEYESIDAFTYDAHLNRLVIQVRGQGLKVYSFPDMKMLSQEKIFPYIMTIQNVARSKYIVVDEELDKSLKYNGVMYVDKFFKKSENASLSKDPMTLELSYPSTFSQINDSTFYIQPGVSSTLFHIGEKISTPLLAINFGNAGVSENVFKKYNYNNEIEYEIVEKQKAAFVHYITKQNMNQLAFWFKYKSLEHNLLCIVDLPSNSSYVYSTKTIFDDQGYFPYPLGQMNEYYISLLEKEDFLRLKSLAGFRFKGSDLGSIKSDNILLLYKPQIHKSESY